MKRIAFLAVCAVCMVIMLTACGREEKQKISTDGLVFTADSYPKIDGSTANIPLAELLAKTFLDISDTEAQNMVAFNTTAQAYENLANGLCDLLIVYEASDETKKRLTDMDAKLEYTPIGKDALVFIRNEGNPVDSLTVSQITEIYSGKIKNWKELGGDDMEIKAFQRDATSGSQSLMKKLVMKDTPMMKAPVERVQQGMGDLIDVLVEYSGEKNAIGYSVYYYADKMYAKPGLAFMKVNGSAPSNQTIRAGAYPLVNEFYAVVRSDSPVDSAERKLAAWLAGENGQKLVEAAGYVPV